MEHLEKLVYLLMQPDFNKKPKGIFSDG